MEYILKNNVDGSKACYTTKLAVSENEKTIKITFDCGNSQFYCSRKTYNGIHSLGDAVEILIGTDPNRREYYEIEVSPENKIMLAKMTYLGRSSRGRIKLNIDFVKKEDCFVKSTCERNDNSYFVTVEIDKSKLDFSKGDIYFNAYRLETDGGETEKYLFALNPTMCGAFHTPDKFVFLKEYV